MENRFEYDPITHIYKINGSAIPSVTQVLQDVGIVDLSDVPPDRLEAARQFGVAVHDACELLDNQDLDMVSLDPALFPYVDAWSRFKYDTGFFMLDNEKAIFSLRHRVAGRPDRVGMMDVLTVVDIKSTASMNPATAVQSGGYKIIYNENRIPAEQIKKRIGVLLKPDGKYKIEPYNDEGDLNVFLSALNVTNWKRRYAK